MTSIILLLAHRLDSRNILRPFTESNGIPHVLQAANRNLGTVRASGRSPNGAYPTASGKELYSDVVEGKVDGLINVERRDNGAMQISGALIWMAIAIVALAIEATNLNLIFLFGGLAALLAGTLAALGVPPVGQILGFAVAALLIPALLRPRLLRRLGSVGVLSRTDALIGQMARVTKAIDPVSEPGRVLVQGHDWAASSTEPILEGALVEVLGSDGIVLLVAPVAVLPSGGNY
jgi:membrane protein implicated in regulation of membrane protease activity